MSEGMTNIEASKRAAGASAQQSFAESVKQTVAAQLGAAIEAEGGGEADNVLSSAFVSVVDNLTTSGVKVIKYYSERVFDREKNMTYYRTYALAQISERDYDRLVGNAFNKTEEQVKANKNARDLLEQAESRIIPPTNK
jgi:UDP-glucose 6-dehydrogenase